MPAAVRPALLLVLLLAAGSLAAEVYRYTDSRGGVVLDRQGVPPEQVAKGYAVLDEQGRVIREVPPAPSAEELRRRAAAQRQAEADAQLRRRYPSLADLDVACASQLRDLDGFLAVTRTMTCPTGCLARSAARTRPPWTTRPCARPRPARSTSATGRTAP